MGTDDARRGRGDQAHSDRIPLDSRQENLGGRPSSEEDGHQYEPSKDQSDAILLNKELVRYGLGEEWKGAYEAVELPDSLSGIQKAVQTAFGRDIRLVAPTSEKFDVFNGIYIPKNKTIYVNAKSDISFINIAGHELFHDIKRRRPDLYAWYIGNATHYIKDLDAYHGKLNELLQDGEKPYGKDAAIEELLGDFMGDSLSDHEFLKRLADSNPSRFRQLMNTVRLWLQSVANKLKGLPESSQARCGSGITSAPALSLSR